jgi:membrane fusion protein, multidrug efflux system
MKTILMSISASALFIFSSCGSGEEHEKHENTKFLVTNPIIMDTTVITEYVCQIHAIQHIELRALEKGYLQKIFVDEGQTVKEGQLMFRIMPMLYQAEAHRAKAEADFAEIEYKNTKALADQNIVSQNELAMAKANFEKAKAQLEIAQVHLGFTEIRAPFTGIMDRFQVRQGSLLDEGDLLTSLSDNNSMWVYFNVPEAEYLNYRKKHRTDEHATISLVMANGEVFNHKGIIETIEADFNNETGNIAFRAAFPNPEGLLRHGETGNVELTTQLNNALIIPQKTTFEILDKKYVYVIDKNNVVRARNITIGQEIPHLYVVTKGLKVGDKILLDGLRKVKVNEKIKYTYVKPEKAISGLDVYAE